MVLSIRMKSLPAPWYLKKLIFMKPSFFYAIFEMQSAIAKPWLKVLTFFNMACGA